MANRIDLVVHGHGSVYLLRALTRRARHWVEERISDDRQEWCGAIVVEHRYLGDIVHGAIADRLEVR